MNTPIQNLIEKSFASIAPFWPLTNLVSVNPLYGFEDLSIEQALTAAYKYFEQKEIPQEMHAVNHKTITWIQAYTDQGQASISVPYKEQGLYASWRLLCLYDAHLHQHDRKKIALLQNLPDHAEQAIEHCLTYLGIAPEKHLTFLTLLLTTLPGWASYIQYSCTWTVKNKVTTYHISKAEYLALRIIITTLLWPQAEKLIDWHLQIPANSKTTLNILSTLEKEEAASQIPLLTTLSKQKMTSPAVVQAQFIFCIDPRSEQLRTHLEQTGSYQTFSLAGFFGLPIKIHNSITGQMRTSCPAIISPVHTIEETLSADNNGSNYTQYYTLCKTLQDLYQKTSSALYLAPVVSLMSGIWTAVKTFFPTTSSSCKTMVEEMIYPSHKVEPVITSIPFTDQCAYAKHFLRSIGLTDQFAPIIVICGHASKSENNAYATALDCGACAGHDSLINAQIMVAILNQHSIRTELTNHDIFIPSDTVFIAGKHITSTQEITLYTTDQQEHITKIQKDIESFWQSNKNRQNQFKKMIQRSSDWAQVRPEKGLAGNNSLLIAPRQLSMHLDLGQKTFLHSYEYTQDEQGIYLQKILTGPLVVAEWINMQYLFSTLHPVTYGSGNKVTQNNTGNIGIMQGTGSDLMTGLPLQSIHQDDTTPYHTPQRLLTIVYAPVDILTNIVHKEPKLQQLLRNGWAHLSCIEPKTQNIYKLNRELEWEKMPHHECAE